MQKTILTEQLMNMVLVTDRFHHTVHTSRLCKTLFNPDSEQNKTNFMGINTSTAEQTFSYLSNFKLVLRSFSYPTSALFTILLLHLKNCDKLLQDPSQQGIIIGTALENIIKDQTSCQSYCIFETLTGEDEVDEENSHSDNEYEDIVDYHHRDTS